jgi:uncharacterized membrane protein
VVFADAVVAIACTLLVLPLVDLATQDAGVPAGRLLSDHIGQFGAFALSFAVIARLWVAHHRLFERVGAYDAVIIWLTLIWLFTVAFLPFPTAILATQSTRAASMLYIGTLLVGSLALASTAAWVSAHAALQRNAEPDDAVEEPHWTTAALLIVAFALAALVPHASVWPLLLLLLSGPIDVLRRRSHRTPSPAVGDTERNVEGPTPDPSASTPADRPPGATTTCHPHPPTGEPEQQEDPTTST